MELLHTIPFGFPDHTRTASRIWHEFLPQSTIIRIATGYITSDSLVELKGIAERNDNFSLELFIGMHYLDLFTRPQYDATVALSDFLTERHRGTVYLSPRARYHGKMYSFVSGGNCIAGFIGSSNLGSFLGTSKDLYETDCFFRGEDLGCSAVNNEISTVINRLGQPFSELPITMFDLRSDMLEGEYGVSRKSTNEIAGIFQSQTDIEFRLPLKTSPRSNLNVYFGAGRRTPRGMIQPRPWYEVEIIVPREITSLPHYPAGRQFNVVTDDGWEFTCSTNGENFKNFRSSANLKILGKWIKRSMENANALTIGNPITEETLNRFGKHYLLLTKTTIPNLWTLKMV